MFIISREFPHTNHVERYLVRSRQKKVSVKELLNEVMTEQAKEMVGGSIKSTSARLKRQKVKQYSL